jgi:hypothetical protein
MFDCCHFYFRLQLPLIIIHITCISLSLRRTSAPIHLTSVLGVLWTQETSCILIAGFLERDTFDLFLRKFDKPWVIHLRETCSCSTNLCTWRPNTVYKNRSVCRHQWVPPLMVITFSPTSRVGIPSPSSTWTATLLEQEPLSGSLRPHQPDPITIDEEWKADEATLLRYRCHGYTRTRTEAPAQDLLHSHISKPRWKECPTAAILSLLRLSPTGNQWRQEGVEGLAANNPRSPRMGWSSVPIY